MKRALTAFVGAAAIAAPVANAAAIATKKPKAKPKKKVVTTKVSVTGDQGVADRWGFVQVTLVVRKTTTTIGAKKTVKRQIVGIDVPVYPDHTDRSIFINRQAVPLLVQETQQRNYDLQSLDWVSGATATTQGFFQSLQSALLKAKQV